MLGLYVNPTIIPPTRLHASTRKHANATRIPGELSIELIRFHASHWKSVAHQLRMQTDPRDLRKGSCAPLKESSGKHADTLLKNGRRHEPLLLFALSSKSHGDASSIDSLTCSDERHSRVRTALGKPQLESQTQAGCFDLDKFRSSIAPQVDSSQALTLLHSDGRVGYTSQTGWANKDTGQS